jgi:ribosome biogenesis GTPase
VLEAVASGELAPRRLASWRKLKRELSFATRRREARVTKSEIYQHRRAEQRRRARP